MSKRRSTWALLAAAVIATAGCKQDASQTAQNPACVGGKCDGEGNGRSPGSDGDEPQVTWTEAGPLWDADWTMLVYAANDDKSKKLVAAFDEDMQEIQHGLGGSAMFRILVQRDYAPHQVDGDGNPRPSERYGLYREQRFNPETMKLEDLSSGETGTVLLGETDTSDPNTLRDFLVYGIRKFPAKKYWVIITGHGDGWNGLAFDASAAYGARLSLAGLRQALLDANKVIETEIRTRPGLDTWTLSRRIDVVQFDACHMGNLETASALYGAADYLMGSQEVVPNAGHPYSALRSLAQDSSGSQPKTAVKLAVTDYVRSYVEGVSTQSKSYVGSTVSSVGMELGKLDAPSNPGGLLDAIAAFRNAVLAERPDGFTCEEVSEIAAAVRRQADLVGTPAEPGRAALATTSSIDLVALFEIIAGFERAHAGLGCNFKPDMSWPLPVQLSDAVRDAAQGVLQVIGRPHIKDADELVNPRAYCGSNPMYADQYRRLVSFKGTATPFIVEAHKVDRSSKQRATGISIFFGDPYPLTAATAGEVPLDVYLASEFEKHTGWSGVLKRCVEQAYECRNWQPSAAAPTSPCYEPF